MVAFTAPLRGLREARAITIRIGIRLALRPVVGRSIPQVWSSDANSNTPRGHWQASRSMDRSIRCNHRQAGAMACADAGRLRLCSEGAPLHYPPAAPAQYRQAAGGFLCLRPVTLDAKLGPVLWQFPPSFRYDQARFDASLAALPRDSNAALALARRCERTRMKGRSALPPLPEDLNQAALMAGCNATRCRDPDTGLAATVRCTRGHMSYVGTLTPCWWTMSLIGIPPSACFRMATICDSVNRLLRIENLQSEILPDALLYNCVRSGEGYEPRPRDTCLTAAVGMQPDPAFPARPAGCRAPD